MKVKELTVSVKYRVGLGGLKMPSKVYDQIIAANESGDTIELDNTKYPEAAEWLGDNIRERDSMDWECEIVDIT